VYVTSGNENSEAQLQQRLQAASELADEGRWDEAFALLREEEADHPTDAVLLCMLGTAARELGAEAHAYEYFRRCLAEQPTDAMVLVTAGAGLAALDDPEAEAALRTAALMAPELAIARLHYGAYLARAGLLADARTELEAARALAPDDARVHTELGVMHLLAGEAAAGTDALEASLEHEEDAWVRALLGLALLEAGRTEESAEELHRASLERLDDAELQLIAALAAAAEGWDDEAWNALARAEAADADPDVVRDVEESVDEGADAARELLEEELAPSALRARLAEPG
jgi:Flp pilus assembly protein TadD